MLPGRNGMLGVSLMLTLMTGLLVAAGITRELDPVVPWIFAYFSAGFTGLSWYRFVRLSRR